LHFTVRTLYSYMFVLNVLSMLYVLSSKFIDVKNLDYIVNVL